jgi:hypothetical protein
MTLTLLLALPVAGCGKFYWQAAGRGIDRRSTEFIADSNRCTGEATGKYEASERIYRRCMQALGWERVQTNYPTDRQYRGPESEEELFRPPNPLSERGVGQHRSDDPTCSGPPAARPSHCRR